MTDPATLAPSLTYMERKALRRTGRGKRSPYSYMWKLRELGLTEAGDTPNLDRMTPLGWGTLDALTATRYRR